MRATIKVQIIQGGKIMYLQISYDGRILSTSGSPYKQVGDHVYLDAYGNVLFELNDYGSVYYYDSYDDDDYERGKIKRIGDTYFYYYGYDDDSYEKGKIKRIGDYWFYYYGYDDDSYEEGKLKRIADSYVYYYGYDDESYEEGKPKKVGDAYLYYDEYGSLKRID